VLSNKKIAYVHALVHAQESTKKWKKPKSSLIVDYCAFGVISEKTKPCSRTFLRRFDFVYHKKLLTIEFH
jgi:hypothetical protein